MVRWGLSVFALCLPCRVSRRKVLTEKMFTHNIYVIGWYNTPSTKPSAQNAAQVRHQKAELFTVTDVYKLQLLFVKVRWWAQATDIELALLRQQLSAQLRFRSANDAEQRGLLVEPRSHGV